MPLMSGGLRCFESHRDWKNLRCREFRVHVRLLLSHSRRPCFIAKPAYGGNGYGCERIFTPGSSIVVCGMIPSAMAV